MRNVLVATVIAALALALAPAFAADGAYKMDAKGNCRDGAGKFASKSLCATAAHTYKLDAKGSCHDETGKFAKKALCKG